MNRFKIIVPCYNAQDYIERCLLSIKNQRYKNWECVVLDDCSGDNTLDVIKRVVKDEPRFHVASNEKRLFPLGNAIRGIETICLEDDDIVAIVDGDDYIAIDALDKVDFVYRTQNAWATYGNYRYSSGELGACKYSLDIFNRLRKDEWNVSHLKTFRYFLYKNIDQEDLKDEGGHFYKAAGDMVLFYPIAEMAAERLKFIPDVLYYYNTLSPINEFKVRASLQQLIEHTVRLRPVYSRLATKSSTREKINVMLYDTTFSHVPSSTGFDTPLYINWKREPEGLEFCPIAVYTDKVLDKEKSTFRMNMAWLIEPRAVDSKAYEYIQAHAKDFNWVLTHERQLLEEIPNAVFMPGGGSWVWRKDFGIHDKTENVCVFCSNKLDTPGHLFRQDICKTLVTNSKVQGKFGDYFKNYVQYRSEALRSYRFCIVMQNCKVDYYWTDALIDCFLSGTVPIYWGCPSIGKFFNEKGILAFDTKEQVLDIVNKVNDKMYRGMLDAVNENFDKAHQYYCLEDYMYLNIIKRIQAEVYVK